jgi:hypothetical protein
MMLFSVLWLTMRTAVRAYQKRPIWSLATLNRRTMSKELFYSIRMMKKIKFLLNHFFQVEKCHLKSHLHATAILLTWPAMHSALIRMAFVSA